MKIEKVSDTQIRVTLNPSDLQDRDIKIGELAYGSMKAQALFKDMMLKAYEDFGFETDNTPLMIEAVPLSTNGIMIVVTKVQDASEIDEKLDAIGNRPTHKSFKEALTSSILDLKESLEDLEMLDTDSTSEEDFSSKEDLSSKEASALLYCFDTFNDVCLVSKYIESLYFGETSLYKFNDKYFLILNKNEKANANKGILVSLLDEFGKRGKSSDLHEMFLKEHGHLLIDATAVDILCKY